MRQKCDVCGKVEVEIGGIAELAVCPGCLERLTSHAVVFRMAHIDGRDVQVQVRGPALGVPIYPRRSDGKVQSVPEHPHDQPVGRMVDPPSPPQVVVSMERLAGPMAARWLAGESLRALAREHYCSVEAAEWAVRRAVVEDHRGLARAARCERAEAELERLRGTSSFTHIIPGGGSVP